MKQEAERPFDEFSDLIEHALAGNGQFREREPERLAGVDAEIDRLVEEIGPLLTAIRDHETALSYHRAIVNAMGGQDVELSEWARGELEAADERQQRTRTQLHQEMTAERVEIAAKIKKLLRVRDLNRS